MQQTQQINTTRRGETTESESTASETLVQAIAKKGVGELTPSVPQHHLAILEDINNDNEILIRIQSSDKIQPALAVCALTDADVGALCLVLEQDTLPAPMILGVVQPANSYPEHVDLYAQKGISLNCGNSTIAINAKGHINVQGKSINSQAYGPNRIKGASVKIN